MKVRSCHFSTQNPARAFTSFSMKSEVNITHYKDVHDLGSLYSSNLIVPEFTPVEAPYFVVLYRPAMRYLKTFALALPPACAIQMKSQLLRRLSQPPNPKFQHLLYPSFLFCVLSPLALTIYLFYIFTLLIIYFPHEILNSMWARLFVCFVHDCTPHGKDSVWLLWTECLSPSKFLC